MNLWFTFLCLALSILPYICNGFILDDMTQPPTKAAVLLSDNHFNMLLSLLVEEKQARLTLENEVQQLRQGLLLTQQGVTSNYHAGQKYNDSLILQSASLQDLEHKYTSLQMKYDSLILEFKELKTNHSILQKDTIQINQELPVLKQLKSVTDLQAIFIVQNQTQHLEKELQASKTILNAVEYDVRARNQDFIALVNKADSTERKLEFVVNQFDMNKNNTNALMLKLENYRNVSENQIQHLKNELQATKTMLNSVAHEVSTRNEDFVALFNKVNAIDHKLELTVIQMDSNKNTTDALLNKIGNDQNVSQTQLNTTIQTQLTMLKSNENLTLTNLRTELYDLYRKMPDRGAVTACANNGFAYLADSIILFPVIHTLKGISNHRQVYM